MIEKYGKIAVINLKYNLLPYLLAAFVVCLVAPLFMGIRNLDFFQSAKVIEMYLIFLGMIVFPPVFQPDVDREMSDVIRTKREPVVTSYIIRILESFFVAFIFGVIFLCCMKSGNCEFPFGYGIAAFVSDICFIGGIELVVFSFSGNPVLAYMVAILYYIANIGLGPKLGVLYLFSMQTGKPADKLVLLVGGILCMVLAIWRRRK